MGVDTVGVVIRDVGRFGNGDGEIDGWREREGSDSFPTSLTVYVVDQRFQINKPTGNGF